LRDVNRHDNLFAASAAGIAAFVVHRVEYPNSSGDYPLG
jgi:hypothetical protein